MSTYLLLLVGCVFIFIFIEPVFLEITKACCFKKPRRGQRMNNGTLRLYSLESLEKSDTSDFTYDMMQSQKYRRALLLLNQQDIDHADQEREKVLPSIENI